MYGEWKDVQRQHRLPRRGRPPLLLGAVHASCTRSVEARRRRRPWRSSATGERVASHVRSYERGGTRRRPSTCRARTRSTLEWTPSRIVGWAETIGPQTRAARASAILAERRHPEQGYRSCLGLLRLAKRYGARAARGGVRARARGAARARTDTSNRSSSTASTALAADRRRRRRQLPLVHENVRGPRLLPLKRGDAC